MKHSDSLNCALVRYDATCKQRKTTPTPVRCVGANLANLATLTGFLASRAEKLLPQLQPQISATKTLLAQLAKQSGSNIQNIAGQHAEDISKACEMAAFTKRLLRNRNILLDGW